MYMYPNVLDTPSRYLTDPQTRRNPPEVQSRRVRSLLLDRWWLIKNHLDRLHAIGQGGGKQWTLAAHSDEYEVQNVEDQPEAPPDRAVKALLIMVVVVIVVVAVVIIGSAVVDALHPCSPSVSQFSGTVQGCS
jgi:hypothetical protein